MRRGTRLGIDVGRARIGVARCDADGILAVPVETVARVPETEAYATASVGARARADSAATTVRIPAGDGGDSLDVQRIVALAREHDVIELVVGHPLSLAGRETASTRDAVGFAHRLQNATGLPVRLVDERMSTVSASGHLHRVGKSTRQQRDVLDQVAAVIILQQTVDAERASGTAPGRVLSTEEGFPPL
ncbi:MAG: Holliday junction resolvase RuvX [Candidatus Lumbricidophila eiseniae]|uniref:Putative pre-16S rRNA nuclease n=1 Tax=Candidatus Lumbricidiphila eiseniae TaxID=1969409 RepID=A0A2A6FTA4_9MICO|nr:MAG: Holliday junction resolvase RuvX [Candidatus Lumbricidophila eiseniae]